MEEFEVVVVGAGVLGLTIARAFTRFGIRSVLVLEKERELGVHSSGRSSGVMHAGLYYATDSLKADFCARGAWAWRVYAHERSISWRSTGKVVVAQDAASVPRLAKLEERARANGVRIERLTLDQLRRVEPYAKSHEFALHSPHTAVIDTTKALEALRAELEEAGVVIRLSSEVIDVDDAAQIVRVGDQEIGYGHLVNAAGLHADRIAHACGVGLEYLFMPFRGSYQRLTLGAARQIRGSIYPTPDPALPFLGIHLTRGVDGGVTIGPNAFPAFGREHYHGREGIDYAEAREILWRLTKMLLFNTSGVRSLAIAELRHRYRPAFVRSVQALAPSVQSREIVAHSKVGIRAQLVRRDTSEFVMDFVVERGPHSTHVLNAVSPGFTCAFPFAEHVVGVATA